MSKVKVRDLKNTEVKSEVNVKEQVELEVQAVIDEKIKELSKKFFRDITVKSIVIIE